ncbi:hypothetical protein CQ018_17460 [Arthrobacter sp. MYb227]|nr:hypothetical protein CQ018_17460 [Arthrobacter sp. MYb227]
MLFPVVMDRVLAAVAGRHQSGLGSQRNSTVRGHAREIAADNLLIKLPWWAGLVPADHPQEQMSN